MPRFDGIIRTNSSEPSHPQLRYSLGHTGYGGALAASLHFRAVWEGGTMYEKVQREVVVFLFRVRLFQAKSTDKKAKQARRRMALTPWRGRPPFSAGSRCSPSCFGCACCAHTENHRVTCGHSLVGLHPGTKTPRECLCFLGML